MTTDMPNDLTTNPPGDQPYDYDEFGLFHENIAEFDLDVAQLPAVERVEVLVDPASDTNPASHTGRHISALRWGADEPEIVLIHGGAQNAHTWDTVALALGRPLVAIDLPGHGHSGWRQDGAYTPMNLADDVAVAIEALAPNARVVVGMSLGGQTSMELAVRHPHVVRSLVMVDVTPGVNSEKTKAITDFVDGPQAFASFDELLERTKQFNPTRSESSLRRGILHNAAPAGDGSWEWRYDRGSRARAKQTATRAGRGPSRHVRADAHARDDRRRDEPTVGRLRGHRLPDDAGARLAVTGRRRRGRGRSAASATDDRRAGRRRCRPQRPRRPPGRDGRPARRLARHPLTPDVSFRDRRGRSRDPRPRRCGRRRSSRTAHR